jgi:hypothetical protein
MYASSLALSFGCDSGWRYIGTRNSSHAKPIAPVTMNAQYQPYVRVIQGTTSCDERADVRRS